MIIRVQNLHIQTIIGTLPDERQHKQEVLVSLAIEFDGRQAAQADDLRQSVDYAALCVRVTQAVEASHVLLLETLAQRILSVVMAEYRVQRAEVEVTKPRAIPNAEGVSVVASAVRE